MRIILFFLKLGIFLVYIFNAIPKVPHTLPSTSLPTHSHFFWPWRSPVLGHIKFASPMGLSLQWWPTRPSFDTYAAKDQSSLVLVSSYCCSTYRVAVPFSSLGNFSSSSIGGRVIQETFLKDRLFHSLRKLLHNIRQGVTAESIVMHAGRPPFGSLEST